VDADVADPSKNLEVLFTHQKKAPGMRCLAFWLICIVSALNFLSMYCLLMFYGKWLMTS